MIQIIDFNPANRHFLKLLNYEWLESYFSVEPADEKQLSDPENEIIARGGYIYFAEMDGQIAGTASLLKVDEGTFELGKMATTQSARGRGIGNLLLQHCIQKAAEFGARRLILYSNRRLEAAIHLYRKYGFYEIEMGNTSYKRSDIRMEKML